MPSLIPPGRHYIIDITGIVVELLPRDYQFPVIQSPAVRFSYAASAEFPYYFANNGLTIRAAPVLFSGLSTADAQISAADGATVSVDPNTNLITLTISAPRASWGSVDLSGRHVIRTALGFRLATCCISRADSTRLFLCNDANSFNGGAGALVLSPGEVLQIVEPSAVLEAPDPTASALGNAAISCSNVSSVNFQGIGFRCTTSGRTALGVANTANPFWELCVIEGLRGLSISVQTSLHSTTLSGVVDMTNASFTTFQSLMKNITSLSLDGQQQVIFESVVRACPTRLDAPRGPPKHTSHHESLSTP